MLRCFRLLVSAMFQSRNRDTFLFKDRSPCGHALSDCRFNLVIEILFFSSRLFLRMLISHWVCFNLVIEILFFSRWRHPDLQGDHNEFQSRNRDTFLFKTACEKRLPKALSLFQSRNRDTFLFKSNSRSAEREPNTFCFNLVIEILFFSSLIPVQQSVNLIHFVSIS